MSIKTEIFSKKYSSDDFVLGFISLFQVDYKSGEPKLLGRKMNFLSFIKKIRGAQGVSYYSSDILIILYYRKTTLKKNIANNWFSFFAVTERNILFIFPFSFFLSSSTTTSWFNHIIIVKELYSFILNIKKIYILLTSSFAF